MVKSARQSDIALRAMLWILVGVVFLAALSPRSLSVAYNRQVVGYFELFFLLAYVVTIKDFKAIWVQLSASRAITTSFLIYFSVLAGSSLYGFISTEGLRFDFSTVMSRMYENSLHAVFGLCAYDVLYKCRSMASWEAEWPVFILAAALPGLWIFVIFVIAWFEQNCMIESCSGWMGNAPLHSNIRFVGEHLAVCCVTSMALFFSLVRARVNALKYFSLLAAVLIFGMLVWLGGRGSFLSVTIVAVLSATILFACHPKLRWPILILILLLIAVAAFAEYIAIYPWSGIFSGNDQSVGYGSVSSASSNRVEVWQQCWDAFLVRTWFGYGGDGFRFLSHGFAFDTNGHHPHNFIIQYLLDVGVVGTGAFLAGLTLFGLKYLPSLWRQKSGLVLAGYMGLTALVLDGLTQATFYNGVPCMLIVYMMVLIAVGDKE